jgi:hypothetical protein
MPSHNGHYYRTHGQAAGAASAQGDNDVAKMGGGKDGKDMKSGKDDMKDGKGKGNIVAVKHSGGPPYQVKHEDGSVTSHDSHEDLMNHLSEHIPGGEGDEDLGHDQNTEALDDMGGSEAAINSLLGS